MSEASHYQGETHSSFLRSGPTEASHHQGETHSEASHHHAAKHEPPCRADLNGLEVVEPSDLHGGFWLLRFVVVFGSDLHGSWLFFVRNNNIEK